MRYINKGTDEKPEWRAYSSRPHHRKKSAKRLAHRKRNKRLETSK